VVWESCTTRLNDLADVDLSLTERSHAGSSVPVNPLQCERTVARPGSIDIPSTAWCVAMISMLNMWYGALAQACMTLDACSDLGLMRCNGFPLKEIVTTFVFDSETFTLA
jgi:hypothetical protein